MWIPFSHTPNYDPASPHAKLQQNSPRTHDNTTHHTKRTNTMLFLVPYLCLSRQPPDVIQRYARLPWSEINGASNDTQRSEQNMVFPLEFGSTPSATWWWPSSDDDVCSLCLSRQPLVVIAINTSTIIRIERDIEWYAAIWTEHCSSPVIWLNVVGDVAIAIRHNNRRIQQSKSYRCR